MKDFIFDDKNKIRYLVVDWIDRHTSLTTGLTNDDRVRPGACEKIDPQLKEVKRFSFRLPHSNWGNAMIICEVLH